MECAHLAFLLFREHCLNSTPQTAVQHRYPEVRDEVQKSEQADRRRDFTERVHSSESGGVQITDVADDLVGRDACGDGHRENAT